MTVLDTETASNVAQIHAARAHENEARNTERLELWKRRMFRDAVAVPSASAPPSWPASRVSIPPEIKVTKIGKRA